VLTGLVGTASSSGEFKTPEELGRVVNLAELVEDEEQRA